MPEIKIPLLSDLLEAANKRFIDIFQSVPAIQVVSPGRINLIGEHTDYNEGYNLPMAIQMVTVMVSTPKTGDGGICCVHTMVEDDSALSTATFNLNSVNKNAGGKNEHWSNYIRGVIAVFQEYGAPRVPAFNAVIVSNLPIGAGLSSSACLEVITLLTCQQLTHFNEYSLIDCALICQRAEHEWAGAPCGLMDQIACLGGDYEHALFIDCRSNTFKLVNTVFEGKVKFLIVESGVRHSIAGGQYQTRRLQCEELAKHFKVHSLREIQEKLPQLEELYNEVCKSLGEVFARRLRHVLTENQRALEVLEAIKNANFTWLGQLMQQSHASMKNDLEISCPELDELVNISLTVDGVYGARLTGGGFGGSVVVLVKSDDVETLIATIDKNYSKTAKMYVAVASEGARVLPKSREQTRSSSKPTS